MDLDAEILIIEDDPNDAEMIFDILKNSGVSNKIQFLEDGAKAIEYISNVIYKSKKNLLVLPKLIMLDLKLPKINGLEVLRELKSDERSKRIPVVILSSSREESDIKISYDLGVNSYVVKPLIFDEFSNAIGNIASYWLDLNEIPK